jgi:LuxR family transcriptional regulator, maltose regulon positive regulatory protein
MNGLSFARLADADRVPAGRGLVQRRLLFRRLAALPAGGVVVVQGPAGSGKTVLVQSWVEAEGLEDRAAWVSVERCERDTQRFWSSLVRELASAAGRDEWRERGSPSSDLSGHVKPVLVALRSLESPLVLVIDDLHELDCPDALERLELFLSSVPPSLRVVLLTREDPQLGLHRLRLTGELTEIRSPDLRFSLEEARELLHAAGISLSDRGLTLLHERTEGWAAGMRLAAISLAQHPDPERFAVEFSGSERTVAGYLLDEVLACQPPEVRDLLLRTSILDEVSGPLADALTGGSGSERILQQLEDAGAFVASLDAGRNWFRYHRLFADLLRLELRRISPMLIDTLHWEAARWYEQNGDVIQAIRHAQAAGNWAYAARLLAEHHLSLVLDGRAVTASALLAAFPADAAVADPELALVFACARAFEGRLEESARYVEAARRLAAVVPREREQHFHLLMANARLWEATLLRDMGAALDATQLLEAALQAQPASALALGRDLRATALTYRGVIELSSSEADTARRHLEQALVLARRAGRPWLEIGCLAHLAGVAQLSGLRLALALRLTRAAVAIVEAHGWQERPVASPAFAIGAGALMWLGRFGEAERWLERADGAQVPEGEPGADPGTELVIRHAKGLLRLAQGRLDEALAEFRTAEQMQTLLAGEHVLTIDVRGRMLRTQVLMGETAAARAALAAIGDPERDRPELRVAAAAMDLAECCPEHAVELLVPLTEGLLETVRPPWTAIEALLFSAAAHAQLGDRRGADASIEQALELAERDRVVLPFTLVPIRDLLERHPRGRTAHATLFSMILELLAGSSPRLRSEPPELSEELSDAELRVVRFLPSNLNAPEIASELFVSANTVRTHLRHIYAKLGVHNRSEAVARARELQLVGPGARQC